MRAVRQSVVCAGSILLCLGAGPLAGQTSQPTGTATLPSGPSLLFDADTKQYNASEGEAFAPFVFTLTNVWTNEVIIERVKPSCGCTTASMPPVPWHIPAHAGGEVHALINLAGKGGTLTKTLTFYTSIGERVATLVVNIALPPASRGQLTDAERKAAMARAAANARAIFQGDCAKCHVEKGRDAMGETLYAADCGICHESPHRESIVPDLHALKQVTDLDYWKTIITMGKPHTLMPGFGAAQGGPLSDAQVNSLATYLDHTISHHLTSAVHMSAAADPVSAVAQ